MTTSLQPALVAVQPAPSVFQKYRHEIDGELHAVLEGFSEPLYDMLRYHLGWMDAQGSPQAGSSGKALRPTLCLLACEAITGSYQRALPAAAALELVHNYSLIHDDIQDDDRIRRNRPTVWAVYGKPQAINAGTAMRVLASVCLMRLAVEGYPPARLVHAQSLLDHACLELLEGQYLDLSFESRFDVSQHEYLRMVEKKTARLISCSLELGAVLATHDRSVILAMRNFGHHLGMAFQVRDDVLGVWGEEDQLGKPVGSDIRHMKKSFPIVLALTDLNPNVREHLLEIYQRPEVDDEAVSRVLELLEIVEARQRSQELVDKHGRLALQEISTLPILPWARQSLEELVNFLLTREY